MAVKQLGSLGPTCVGLALLLAGCGSSSGPSRPPVKHVLLVVVDTLRADHVGVYGHERDTTPHIDTLAERGIVFERAISQSSWTAPSMISLMSSRYVASGLVSIPEEVPSLAEWMQAGGFATAAFVRNPILEDAAGFSRGFDRYEVGFEGFTDQDIVQWIEANKENRTFTYVHLGEPHSPYGSRPGRYHWAADPPELPTDRVEYYRDLDSRETFEGFQEGLETIRESVAGYDDDVSFDDDRIGHYLRAVRRAGLWTSTAILLTSDHGEGLWTRPAYAGSELERKGDTGRLQRLDGYLKSGHGNQVHHELVHVPLILAAPGLPRGERISALVENVDIVPTLLELCALPHPGSLAGRSLLQAIEDPSDWLEDKPWAFTSTRLMHSVLSPDGWQLMLPSDLGVCRDGLEPELYYLPDDPEARVNLAGQHPEIERSLGRALYERLEGSLQGSSVIDPTLTDMAALQALGYLSDGTVDVLSTEMADQSNMSLLETLGIYGNSCLVRLQAARELERRELSRAEYQRARELLQQEPSAAIRRVMEVWR